MALRYIYLIFCGGVAGLLAACGPAARSAAVEAALTRHGLKGQELQRWAVSGARQGVAVDEQFFYAIDDARVARHEKRSGRLVNEWTGPHNGKIRHLNSGLLHDGLLVASHSNYPRVPMTNSLEFFDPVSLQPVKSVNVSAQHGSLVWAERKDGFWWVCFANYDGYGGVPGRDHRETLLTQLDDRWQWVRSWHFPQAVLAVLKPWSSSGGSWGDDGLLYVTGHDARELYVLRLPKTGDTLEYVTTIDVPFEGQAWAWDRSQKRVLYAISRTRGEVVVVRVPELQAELLTR